MTLNPPSQYADDRNLLARQRLWQQQVPFFDIAGWAVDLASVTPGQLVLDAGCGNGLYLRELRDRGVRAIGCDLSAGMLRSAGPGALVNGDLTALPFRDGAFDAVIAAHVLDLVPDREAAIRELRRVLAPGGRCVAVTNGTQHLQTLRELIERAAGHGTLARRLVPPTAAFRAENGEAQLSAAFDVITAIRPGRSTSVLIRDPAIVADYVASMGDHYKESVGRPWAEVVDDVRGQVERLIAETGAFTTAGDLVAFVCQ
jgi:SAM-dependent methyltransferase